MHLHSIHLRRMAAKSHCRARAATRQAQPVVLPSFPWCRGQIQSGMCARTIWFLVGGVAVVCWTEGLGTKKHGWSEDELHKLHDKRMEHIQHITSTFGSHWAAMHKERERRCAPQREQPKDS